MIFTAGPPVLGDWYDATTVGQSVNTGERREVIQGASRAHYVSSGHLVYSRAASLFAVPFDAGTLRATGAPSRILEGVREDQSTGASQVAVSANGSLAYVPGGLSVSELVWVDRRGAVHPLSLRSQPAYFYAPRLSPDGRRIAVTMASGNDDIWLFDLERETLSRFTSGANHLAPGWTPDGKHITYLRSHTRQVVWKPADGVEARNR